MLAAQALVGVAAQGVAEVEDRVTLPQLRVLVLVAARGGLNLNALAAAMNVHPSNASRSCDRLVAAGLLTRTESAIDRRNLILELTGEGHRLLQEMIDHRRAAVVRILEGLSDSRRRTVAGALRSFSESAGEVPARSAWKLGWRD